MNWLLLSGSEKLNLNARLADVQATILHELNLSMLLKPLHYYYNLNVLIKMNVDSLQASLFYNILHQY